MDCGNVPMSGQMPLISVVLPAPRKPEKISIFVIRIEHFLSGVTPQNFVYYYSTYL